MSMNNDIYLVFFHYAQICFCIYRLWSSEHNVRELSSAHGTAPSVRHTSAKGLSYQSFRLGRTSHMGHMHGCGNLTVNSSWFNLSFFPQFSCVFRRSGQPSLNAEGFSVL